MGRDYWGNFSSTQSAVVIPKPGSGTIYYVFTVPDYIHNDGFRYSEVDMALNGGLGDVTLTKNILLVNQVSEKVTAIQKTNGSDYWVVTHSGNSNKFYSFSITESGINVIPVVSSVGASVENTNQKIGYMKFSPNGTKLLYAATEQEVRLFNFDENSGLINNPVVFADYFANYGLEFSPSGNIAYLTSGDGYVTKLYQYDLTASNIQLSETLLYSTDNNNVELGALQLAPDGKICLSIYDESFISVINSPDVLGNGCNFLRNAVSLGSGRCMNGLPQFIQSYFSVNISFKNICYGDVTKFSPSGSQNITSVVWDFGDGFTSTSASPSHTYDNPGTYTVSLSATGPRGPITKEKTIIISDVPVANVVSNKNICLSAGSLYPLTENNTDILGTQDQNQYSISYFLTEADAIANQNILPDNYNLQESSTVFYGKIFNKDNKSCYSITNFTLHYSLQPLIVQVSDYVKCDSVLYDGIEQFDLASKNTEILNGQSISEFSITYHTSQNDADTAINELDLLYENESPYEQQIFFRIENSNNQNCFKTSSFKLLAIQKPEIGPLKDFIFCDDDSNDGRALFDLSLKSAEILGSFSLANFQVQYYLTEDDAISNNNPLNTSYTNVVNNQVIYTSLSSLTDQLCIAISSFKLIVTEKPALDSLPDLRMCSENGSTQFNLQNYSKLISNNFSLSQFNITFYHTSIDAASGNNEIDLLYESESVSEIIYVRIVNKFNQDCFAVRPLNLYTDILPNVSDPTDFYECESTAGSNEAVFNLASKGAEILGNFNPAQFTLTYYTSEISAQTSVNALATENYMTGDRRLFARLENNSNTDCFAIVSFE